MTKKAADAILSGLAEAAQIAEGQGGAAGAYVGGAVPATDVERRLRQLLLELYASGMLWHPELPPDEQARLLDTVLAAAERREFDDLGLPFPRA